MAMLVSSRKSQLRWTRDGVKSSNEHGLDADVRAATVGNRRDTS